MNKHSADATTAEEAIAIQSALDSDMATEVAEILTNAAKARLIEVKDSSEQKLPNVGAVVS